MMTLADLICPFCSQSFELPDSGDEYLDAYHASSCGCGAMFCLIAAGDEEVTEQEVRDIYPAIEIRLLHKIDTFSLDENSERVPIHALFWLLLN